MRSRDLVGRATVQNHEGESDGEGQAEVLPNTLLEKVNSPEIYA